MIDRGIRAISWRPPPSSPAARLGAVAPIPFVGMAAILVALIIFTPVLLSSGPSPLAVRAELFVYRVVGASTTEFLVRGYDPSIPYGSIDVSVGTGFPWTGSCPTSHVSWNYTNETNEEVASLTVGSYPVVVNASAIYDQSGTRTVYDGELAFNLVNPGSSGETIVYVPCPWNSGAVPGGSWAVSGGTLPIPLANYGGGGP